MVRFLIWLISVIVQSLTMVVIIQVFLSYFLSPYHPLRSGIDRLVNPLLQPIRRILPNVGIFDFSPLIFILLLQLSGKILTTLLIELGS